MDARRRWHFQTTTLNLSSSSSLSNDQRTKISNCEAIFSNGSIWLLGRRHWELGPVVGGCPGLPHGEARPGRAPRGPRSCSRRLQRTIALPWAGSRQAEVSREAARAGGLEDAGSSQPLLLDFSACVCSLAATPEATPTGTRGQPPSKEICIWREQESCPEGREPWSVFASAVVPLPSTTGQQLWLSGHSCFK